MDNIHIGFALRVTFPLALVYGIFRASIDKMQSLLQKEGCYCKGSLEGHFLLKYKIKMTRCTTR